MRTGRERSLLQVWRHREKQPFPLGDWGKAGTGPRWFLDTEAEGGHAGPPLHPADTAGALLVGPEGGLAPEERQELLASGWQPVGLGERILRLETAAVVGAALLLLFPSGIKNPKP